ncbi:MAG: hypothetical protein J6T10_01605 [Methanobrevibacter sp.]|nr:hypothetical protein [Methanobrevibacter sp.]
MDYIDFLENGLDNAIDEYLAGYNKNIWVFYNTKTKQTTVVDNGRGIPVGWNEKAQMNSLTLVFTQLHAGGKFNHDAYKTSSGLNGIGQKAIAALSKQLQVWSNNSSDNWFYTQTFEKGIVTSEVSRCRLPEEYKGLIKKKGTIVQWTPDETIFTDSTDLDLPRLKKELGDIQYLCPGLHIHLLIDDNEEIEFYSENGLTELVSHSEDDTVFTFQDDFTDVAVNFTKQDGNTFKSFVNVCYTNLGGTHLNGLKKTICNVIKANSKKKILNDDILEGVIGAIHHKMSDPQYQGQTKNELTNTPVEKEIIEKLTGPMEKFFRKNKDLLNRIVEYAEKMFEQKEKMKASKDLLKGLKTLNAGSKYISDKFLDADRRKYKNPKDLEMFIVEGDSAGGHFKQAREGFQGELKLKGKIINAAKATPEELFGKPQKKGEAKCEGNREIKDLVAALGCGIQADYDESKLRFGKVILLTDADTDGGHISNLCTAFFVNYMPDLIKNGHLYIIDAPLFMATGSKQKVFGMTRGEVDKQMKQLKCSDYTVTRLKGWGECTPEQLSEICLNPQTRKLIQIKWTDVTEKACEDTMGEGTAFRKELLGIDK